MSSSPLADLKRQSWQRRSATASSRLSQTGIYLPLSRQRVAAGHATDRSRFAGPRSEAAARATAFQWWPNAGLRGTLNQELPLPSHFEQAAEMVSEDDIADAVPCGPDPAVHLAKIQEYLDAGFDHLYIHQVGPDQHGFFEFYENALEPELKKLSSPEPLNATNTVRLG